MEKGIFTLICTVVILITVTLCTISLSKQISTLPGLVVYKQVTVIATPTPIVVATPSAAVKKVVVTPVK